MQEINIAVESVRLGGAVIYPLLVLAVLAAVVILDKAFIYWRYMRLSGLAADAGGDLFVCLDGIGSTDGVGRNRELLWAVHSN